MVKQAARTPKKGARCSLCVGDEPFVQSVRDAFDETNGNADNFFASKGGELAQ